MSINDHEELIQGEIDGVNSAADSARLKELLARDPGLRARYEALLRVSGTLGEAERLEPPPDLLEGVMSEVHRREPAGEARLGWLDALRALLTPGPLAACACTLVVGLVLGALLPPDSGLFSRSEREALSGTALDRGRLGSPGVLDRRSLARDGVQGEALTRLDDGRLVVEVRLDTTVPVDVTLDLDGTGLSPRSFSQDGPSDGGVVLGAGQVRFSHPAGRRLYTVSFVVGKPASRALLLRVGEGDGWELSLGGRDSR